MRNQIQQEQSKLETKPDTQPPIIPDKLYFNIGEVAKLCDLKPHVLRYWEEEFDALTPVKRRGNRRYYQRGDVVLVRQIKDLLYVQGFTIEGAKLQLATIKEEAAANPVVILQQLLSNLESVLTQLETV